MLSKKFIVFYDEINFIIQIVAKLLDIWKWIEFGSVIIANLLCWMIIPIVIMSWLNCCKVFWLCWHKRYSILRGFFLISFLVFMNYLQSFLWADNTGNLVNSCFGVKILIPVPVFCLSKSNLSAIVSWSGSFFI